MPKRFRIDYYQVKVPGEVALHSMLEDVASRTEMNRNAQFNDGVVRLRFLEKHDGLYRGDIVRLRFGDPAFKGKKRGGLESVIMDDDEALGEQSAFLYHPKACALLIQRNRSGVNADRFASYFEIKMGLDKPIEFLPYIDPRVMERLQSMQELRTFRVRLAQCESVATLASDVDSVGEAISIANNLKAPEIELKVSMGRRKGGLNMAEIFKMVKSVIRIRGRAEETVKSLEVRGINDDGVAEPLDLLAHRLKDTATVEPSHFTDEYFKRRLDGLLESWDRKRANVLRYSG